jgi:ribosome assembly protein YihI (activator of Der GTPase)
MPKRRRAREDDELVPPKKITGKELSELEELSARLTALVETLDARGVINKKEYDRSVAMRLHEISKAAAIEELDEEL